MSSLKERRKMRDSFDATFRKGLLPGRIILNDDENISSAVFTDLHLTLVKFLERKN